MRAAPLPLLSLLLGFALPAAAQQPVSSIPVQTLPPESPPTASETDATPVQLEAVKITADKLGRREGQGSESVRVVTAKELSESNARDLYDVFRRVANTSVNEGNSAQRGGFTIRGIVDTGPGSDGIGSSSSLASVYVDGAVLTTQGNAAGPVDTWDLAQVEVLRGPQSTTQGRNALAGAIVLRSADPTPFWEARALLQAGELRSSQTAFAGGGPLIDDTLAFRVAYNRLLDAGAVKNTTRRRDDWDRGDARRGRAKLRFTPAFWPGAVAQLTHTESEVFFGDAVVNRERAASGERVSESSEDEYSTVRSGLDSLEVELPAFGGTFTSVSGRSATTRDQQYDFNRSARPDDGLIRFDNEDEALSQELRYRHRGERLQWVAGVYGADVDEALDLRIRDAVITVAEGVEFVLDGDILTRQKKRNAALFGEADYRVRPRTTLTLGLRYDTESVDFAYDGEYRVPRGSVGGVPVPGAVIEPLVDQSGQLPPDTADGGRNRYAAWLPKLGLRYAFSDTQTLGLTVQRGYRAGGVSINPVRGTLRDFDPEFTDNLELAWRNEWLQRRLRARVNAFYLLWRDQQVDVALSGNPLDTQTENAGRSRLYGGETELRYRLGRRLEVFGSAGYTRTRFVDFTSASGSNFEGNEFPNAPRFTGLVGATLRSLGGYFLTADVSHQLGSYRRPDNAEDERNEGRNLVNARVGWESRAVTVFLAARNLTDTYAVSSKAGNGATVSEPRVVTGGVEVRLR